MNIDNIRQQKIILFDGICNLCSNSVVFVLQHETKPVFKFASIQSEAGKKLLTWCGLPSDYCEAVVLIDQGKRSLGSTAALKIGQTLSFPWSLISSLGLVVPKFIRDWVYGQIVTHRYQWFGKQEICMVPTQELRSRFL